MLNLKHTATARAMFRGRIDKAVGISSITPRIGEQHSNFRKRWLSAPSGTIPKTDYIKDENKEKRYSFLFSLPWQFLRCSDMNNFDSATSQRNDVFYNHENGKPDQRKPSNLSKNRLSINNVIIDDSRNCEILWNDGSRTFHDTERLEQQYLSWQRKRPEDRILWENLTESDVRRSSKLSMSYNDLIFDGESGMSRALEALYRHGILLVTETPVDDNGAGIAALGAALSGGSVKDKPSASLLAMYRAGEREVVLPDGTDGPLRTLYGGVWATTSAGQPNGTSVADSAYSSDALPLHTDSTYFQDPPGLQIFTMVQPALVGGESIFCDGFAIAETLKTLYPTAFNVLSNTSRTFHSKDEVTGWYLKATGSVIQERNGRIIAIRHNDLDRLPDLPTNDMDGTDIDRFYDDLESAHAKWDHLIAQDKYRLVMKLGPGDTMIVANQVRKMKITVFCVLSITCTAT